MQEKPKTKVFFSLKRNWNQSTKVLEYFAFDSERSFLCVACLLCGIYVSNSVAYVFFLYLINSSLLDFGFCLGVCLFFVYAVINKGAISFHHSAPERESGGVNACHGMKSNKGDNTGMELVESMGRQKIF